MVRIRGLRRALGRLLGRALGRHVSCDAEEAPKLRRPTTSACRQQATVAIAEDVNHVDHVVDEVHEQPQEPVTNHVGVDIEGFPGGPHDTSMLTSYVDHVTTRVWAGKLVICSII